MKQDQGLHTPRIESKIGSYIIMSYEVFPYPPSVVEIGEKCGNWVASLARTTVYSHKIISSGLIVDKRIYSLNTLQQNRHTTFTDRQKRAKEIFRSVCSAFHRLLD